jgi:hypothetical protein
MTLRAAIGTTLFGLACVIGVGCSAAPDGAPGEASESTTEALPKCPVEPLFGGDCPNPRPIPTPKPKPPIATTTCSFDGLVKAENEGPAPHHRDLGAGFPPDPISGGTAYHVNVEPPFCVSNSATDPLSVAQRTLMSSYGCSAPFYWESWDTSGGYHIGDDHQVDLTPVQLASCQADTNQWLCWSDRANAYIQLCPLSAQSYLEGTGNAPDMTDCKASGGLGCLHDPKRNQMSDLRAHGPNGFMDTVIPSPPAGWGWAVLWEDPSQCNGGCMCDI